MSPTEKTTPLKILRPAFLPAKAAVATAALLAALTGLPSPALAQDGATLSGTSQAGAAQSSTSRSGTTQSSTSQAGVSSPGTTTASSTAAQADPAAGEVQEETGSQSLISLPAGVEEGMLDPSFWTTDRTVLLTPEQVSAINEANPLRVSYYDAQGGLKSITTYKCPATLPGEDVRALLSVYNVPGDENTMYSHGKEVAPTYWAGVRARMNLDAVPDEVQVGYGICVDRTIAYAYPDDGFYTSSVDDNWYDESLIAEVLTGDGVVVLHQTTDGEWSFVLVYDYAGWVRTDTLALCEDFDTWQEALNPESFLTVTGNNVLMDVTAETTATSGMVLPMGTKVALVDDAPSMVGGRATFCSYVAKLPTRGADGMLEWETVLIPYGRDVTPGYLEYSSAALVEQAFKFMGQLYGWGGLFQSNDCSGVVRQVYRCFGIQLPRNSSSIAVSRGLFMGQFGTCGEDVKLAVLDMLRPGALLEFPGHITMYLGQVDGVHYVFSAVGTFMVPDDDGELEAVTTNCACVTTLEGCLRRSGLTWLECLTHWVCA